jgi:hypothetical protein
MNQEVSAHQKHRSPDAQGQRNDLNTHSLIHSTHLLLHVYMQIFTLYLLWANPSVSMGFPGSNPFKCTLPIWVTISGNIGREQGRECVIK